MLAGLIALNQRINKPILNETSKCKCDLINLSLWDIVELELV